MADEKFSSKENMSRSRLEPKIAQTELFLNEHIPTQKSLKVSMFNVYLILYVKELKYERNKDSRNS